MSNQSFPLQRGNKLLLLRSIVLVVSLSVGITILIIDHEILKKKLVRVFTDADVLNLLYQIIDSFEVTPGKGLPMGNQTSQWFAIYYLDGFDRQIKEKLRIKYYSRYMDDCVLIHPDKQYLKECLVCMREYVQKELQLNFNEKTQVFPLRSGVDYLGWHIYLSDTGKGYT